jgi:hypothetical protein
MKRLLLVVCALVMLVVPAGASAFHHTGLPARFCAADAAGSPSNDNGMAKEALTDHPVFTLGPGFPPNGTPGAGQGEGEDQCANAEAD